MSSQFEVELAVVRKIARSKPLSIFHRNATTWEFVLLLAAKDGGTDEGIYNTLQRLETPYLGHSAMLKFLRDRRLEGSVTYAEQEKRSKWGLRLAPSVFGELKLILEQRNLQLCTALVQQDQQR